MGGYVVRASGLMLWVLFAYILFTAFELGLPAIIMTGVSFFIALNFTLVRNTHIEAFNEKHKTTFDEEIETIKNEQKNEE